MKPGKKTSEFYITLVAQVVASLVVLINVLFGKNLDVDIYTKVVTSGGAFGYALYTAIYYTRSRVTLKVNNNERKVEVD